MPRAVWGLRVLRLRGRGLAQGRLSGRAVVPSGRAVRSCGRVLLRPYSGREVAITVPYRGPRALACLVLLSWLTVTLASCGATSPARSGPAHAAVRAKPPAAPSARNRASGPGSPLALSAPAPLVSGTTAGQGRWRAVGRRVRGYSAVYETRL